MANCAIPKSQLDGAEDRIHYLEAVLNKRDEEIRLLKVELQNTKDVRLTEEKIPSVYTCTQIEVKRDSTSCLSNPEIARYSRQLILPELGVAGQIKLKSSCVLIIGAGGLGCPAAIYLTAAGIGRLGVVDYDDVEISNLHRQILHRENRVNRSKSASLAASCIELNSGVEFVPYHLALSSQNALDIIREYDIVVDATDNVATRYLLNDACILAGKPLVSGSALRFEGQLTVYNYQGGPCYRCLHPQPPPPETVTNCSDGGVLGAVPGVIGTLQATEVMKIVVGMDGVLSQKLLLYDALDCSFQTIKLRPKKSQCVVCGDSPSVTQLIDYEQFCGALATDKEHSVSLLEKSDRVDVHHLNRVLQDQSKSHLLVDVRPNVELEICKLPGAINIPVDNIHKPTEMEKIQKEINKRTKGNRGDFTVYVVCRRGNDSQHAVVSLQKSLAHMPISIKDVTGGLTAWAKHIDTDFPVY